MQTIAPTPYLSDDMLKDAIEHLRVLIGFDTVSKNTNRPLISHMAAFFENLGADITILPDPTGEKANLVAVFGPQDQPGIVWSGHTDVVPAVEPEWQSDPFTMLEHEGKLYGRGTSDMKGFAACVMAVAPYLAKAKLTRPVYLCFSYDEEVGCKGAPDIVRHLSALPVPPELALVGEPSEMQLITGHKGKTAMRATVKGTSGHSSLAPEHVNAIEYGARAIAKVTARAAQFAAHGPFDHDYPVAHPTMLTTMITGGTATNITPDLCEFTFELRSIAELDAQAAMAELMADIEADLSQEMAAKAQGTGITFEEIFSYPAMSDARDSAGFERYSTLWPQWAGKVCFGAEGGLFDQMGDIPSVIVGPGSIERAHKPNEYIGIEELRAYLGFLGTIISFNSAPD
ncbi:acetylornithine deacetylase [Rhodobacteraceae bacterium]|nr:acetylornithine deacetylase [Paracoccaceae bacterium]